MPIYNIKHSRDKRGKRDQRKRQNRLFLYTHSYTKSIKSPRIISSNLIIHSSKLASYASPPLSPKPWADINIQSRWSTRWPTRWDLMDGERKQNERLMSRSGNSTARSRNELFESAMQNPQHPRADPTGLSQAPDRAAMSYDYGYTGSSFTGGSLQSNELATYPPEFVRPRQTPSSTGQGHGQGQQRRRAQEVPPFEPYESAMLYGFGQQGPAPGPFEVVPQYPPRQSAAIEALSSQFAVPQYFNTEEPSATGGVPGLSPYLNAQLPQAYNQPSPMGRPSTITMQPFPAATMSDFTPIGPAGTGAGRLDQPAQQQQQHQQQQQQPQQSTDSPQQPSAVGTSSDPSNLDEAYSQYRRALRSTFDHTRAGRLVEASRSLLEISEWLVANARDLGRFGSFRRYFIFYIAGGTMLVQGCCRGVRAWWDVVPNRTLAWALFLKTGICIIVLCSFLQECVIRASFLAVGSERSVSKSASVSQDSMAAWRHGSI